MHGPRVCSPHAGPAVWMTHLITTFAFLGLFLLKHGCFLVPCLCAPEGAAVFVSVAVAVLVIIVAVV